MTLPPYPSGWYAVGLSRELAPGAVATRPFMGGEVVVYRTRSGVVRAVEPYCAHLGAHLGVGGTVDGELLVCPFHHFAYDERGACVRTGYGTKPPPSARLARHEVREVNGLLLVWYGAARPSWGVPELDGDEWSSLRVRSYVLRDHPQETTENSVDLGHFAIVHGYREVRMLRDAVADGPYLSTAYSAVQPPGLRFEFDTQIFGLGYSLVNVCVPRLNIDARLWVLPTPIDEERLTLRLAASTRGAFGRAVNPILLWGLARGASQDFPIWENKRFVERPALADGDGPIGLYRRWARQFYEDVAAPESPPQFAISK